MDIVELYKVAENLAPKLLYGHQELVNDFPAYCVEQKLKNPDRKMIWKYLAIDLVRSVYGRDYSKTAISIEQQLTESFTIADTIAGGIDPESYLTVQAEIKAADLIDTNYKDTQKRYKRYRYKFRRLYRNAERKRNRRKRCKDYRRATKR